MVDLVRATAARGGHGAVEACWLCGIRLPVAQLLPDGGDACTDVRWYCRDARACTQRWTAHPAPAPAAEPPMAPPP